VVDLAGIDELLALKPADIEPVEGLALGAGLLQPVIAAAGGVAAVADLGDHALQADRSGMLEHLAAVDLETLAELDGGLGDQFFQMRLALDQRELS
jgi:hypothetical protein